MVFPMVLSIEEVVITRGVINPKKVPSPDTVPLVETIIRVKSSSMLNLKKYQNV